MTEDLEARIKRHEGLRLVSYQDSLGYWTIGYGHFIGQPCDPITKEQAEEYLETDIQKAKALTLHYFPWSSNLDQRRYEVLVEMVFQLGISKVCAFHKMLTACQDKDWQEVANQMLDSLWHKQTLARCEELANIMLTGETA